MLAKPSFSHKTRACSPSLKISVSSSWNKKFSSLCRPVSIVSNQLKSSSNNSFIAVHKSKFHSTRQLRSEEYEDDEAEESVDKHNILEIGTDHIKLVHKPVIRSYDSQFYSKFPNLITKKKGLLDFEDWVKKEIEESTAEFHRLKKIYFRDDDIESIDQNARNFVISPDLTVYSGVNTEFTDEVLKTYLPEGWGKRNKINLEFEALGEKNVFTRAWIFDIIDEINRQRENNFLKSKNSKTLIATGFHGIGISTLLSVLTIYGRSNNWITVNVSGIQITSDYNIDPSRVLKKRYDQNKVAMEIIQHTIASNHSQLATIPLRTPIPNHLLEEGLVITKDTTILDVLNYGLENEDSATDVFCYFRRELNLVTEYPVLLIVDDYNTLFNDSYYPDMHNPSYAVQRLPADRLNLVRCFNEPYSTGLLNGVMVCGTTGVEPRENMTKKIGTQLNFHVPALTFEDVEFRMKYYANRQWAPDDLPNETIKFIHQVTCGSFLELAKYTKFLG